MTIVTTTTKEKGSKIFAVDAFSTKKKKKKKKKSAMQSMTILFNIFQQLKIKAQITYGERVGNKSGGVCECMRHTFPYLLNVPYKQKEQNPHFLIQIQMLTLSKLIFFKEYL